MELSSQEGEIPIPLNSAYGGGGHGHSHMIHHDHHPSLPHNHHNHNHNHIIATSAAAAAAAAQIPSSGTSLAATNLDDDDDHHHVSFHKKVVRYRECLKNHAAAMGGTATDGCGEFMPSGEEGTIEALTCSACNCHRNFHRKEIEGEPSSCDYYPLHSPHHHLGRVGRKLILGHPHHHHKGVLPPEALGYPTATGTLIHSRAASAVAPTPHQMMMSYNMMGSLPSESDEQEDVAGGVGGGGGGGGVVTARPPHHHQLVKKRFRTKFTQEQKEKMLNFAEKVGWKIQKQEEAVVQQFCQEIGVKRRVLKVWMHNNKHNLAKKNPSSTNTNTNTNNTTTATTTPAA